MIKRKQLLASLVAILTADLLLIQSEIGSGRWFELGSSWTAAPDHPMNRAKFVDCQG